MKIREHLVLVSLSALVLLLGAGAPGCGGATVESVCGKCGATGATLDKCVGQGNDMQAATEKAGCPDAFQAYLDCADESGTCNGDEVAAEKACKAEYDAIEKCGVHF